jgi:hypothetical protein
MAMVFELATIGLLAGVLTQLGRLHAEVRALREELLQRR